MPNGARRDRRSASPGASAVSAAAGGGAAGDVDARPEELRLRAGNGYGSKGTIARGMWNGWVTTMTLWTLKTLRARTTLSSVAKPA
jgi:hypothetical protein